MSWDSLTIRVLATKPCCRMWKKSLTATQEYASALEGFMAAIEAYRIALVDFQKQISSKKVETYQDIVESIAAFVQAVSTLKTEAYNYIISLVQQKEAGENADRNQKGKLLLSSLSKLEQEINRYKTNSSAVDIGMPQMQGNTDVLGWPTSDARKRAEKPAVENSCCGVWSMQQNNAQERIQPLHDKIHKIQEENIKLQQACELELNQLKFEKARLDQSAVIATMVEDVSNLKSQITISMREALERLDVELKHLQARELEVREEINELKELLKEED